MLNMWIRAPGIVITTYILYINRNIFLSLLDYSLLSYLIFGFVLAGTLWNGMYFLSTIIRSYERLSYLKKEKVN